MLDKAKQNNMMVCLDINYRPAFWDDTSNAPTRIDEAAKRRPLSKQAEKNLLRFMAKTTQKLKFSSGYKAA